MDKIFLDLQKQLAENQVLMAAMAEKIERLESIGGGGGGTASIEDYTSGKVYKRNVLVVDTATETVYRVLEEYVSDTVENDCANKKLKVVGFESQIITTPHNPTQSEINNYPDDSLVAVYSTTDAPYAPQE